MPLRKGWSRETQSENIRRLMRERTPSGRRRYEQKQAVAIALEEARRSGGGARGAVGPNPNRARSRTWREALDAGAVDTQAKTRAFVLSSSSWMDRFRGMVRGRGLDMSRVPYARLNEFHDTGVSPSKAIEVLKREGLLVRAANRSRGAPYGGVGTATRYSGHARVRVSYDDRTNQYRAAVSVLAPSPRGTQEYVLRTRQAVGRPPAATGSVDSAAAFDESARAALSFAMHEDKVDASELSFTEADEILVSRSQPGTKAHRRERQNASGPYEVRDIGSAGHPMGLDEYAWQVAERLVRNYGFAPNQAEGAVNEWSQYVRTAYSMALGASTTAKNVAHRAS